MCMNMPSWTWFSKLRTQRLRSSQLSLHPATPQLPPKARLLFKSLWTMNLTSASVQHDLPPRNSSSFLVQNSSTEFENNHSLHKMVACHAFRFIHVNHVFISKITILMMYKIAGIISWFDVGGSCLQAFLGAKSPCGVMYALLKSEDQQWLRNLTYRQLHLRTILSC